jgi:16S rRNA processing protein RimM
VAPLAEYFAIGQALRPQGLRGEVKIRPDTDDPGRFLRIDRVFLRDATGNYLETPVCGARMGGGFVYLTIGGDAGVEDAQKRRGQFLYLPREEAVPLGEFENFISDVIGCEVRDTLGAALGVVQDVLQPGANDVYRVKTQDGFLLIPALRHVILQVDTKNRLVTVDAQRLGEVSVRED